MGLRGAWPGDRAGGSQDLSAHLSSVHWRGGTVCLPGALPSARLAGQFQTGLWLAMVEARTAAAGRTVRAAAEAGGCQPGSRHLVQLLAESAQCGHYAVAPSASVAVSDRRRGSSGTVGVHAFFRRRRWSARLERAGAGRNPRPAQQRAELDAAALL